jgi:hypothetical protein
MASMNEHRAPQRCDARVRRLARVKFMALPLEAAVDSGASSILGRLAARLRDFSNRVLGCLEAARP